MNLGNFIKGNSWVAVKWVHILERNSNIKQGFYVKGNYKGEFMISIMQIVFIDEIKNTKKYIFAHLHHSKVVVANQ